MREAVIVLGLLLLELFFITTCNGFVVLTTTRNILLTTTSRSSKSIQQVMSMSSPTAAAAAVPVVIDAPYGAWESPITSKAITTGSVGISSLKLVDYSAGKQQHLLWLESRPQEGGRLVLCRYDDLNNATEKNKSQQRNAIDVTPPGTNARTRVHEYGGGAVTLGKQNENDENENDSRTIIFYSEFTTQRVMKLLMSNNNDDTVAACNADPVAITPDCVDGACRYRFADGQYDASNKVPRLVMVREDHTNPAPKDVVNEIVSVTANGDGADASNGSSDGGIQVLATGNDFYASPRLSPPSHARQNKKHKKQMLAYVTWNHPNMPWDASELRVATLPSNDDDDNNDKDDDKTFSFSADTSTHTLVAGDGDETSILQPTWHPMTGELFYISDETGYYNIYKINVDSSSSSSFTKTTKTATAVLPMPFDFGGASPGWMLGQQGYGFLADGRLFATYSKDGSSRLVVANVTNGEGPATDIQEYDMQDGLPMMFGGIVASASNDLYFIGGSPSTPTSVFKWSLNSPGRDAEQLACSSTLQFSPEIVSIPKQIEFPTTMGKTAFGYYYAPCNEKYKCTTEQAPPLLVKAHGGPTSCTGTSFNAVIQYWTSRGFAVLDVDYGGSTGYGRDYRRRLRGAWGIVDVDDVCAGAQYLVQQGLADAKRLCIDGGSAGGYTTLSALAFRDTFRAGTSLYGIGDLSMLAGDTHKFESRYLDGLVGEYPKDMAVYKARSPIESVDTLNCPILLLQGVEDKVVPPNQAESMHQALLKKGLPTCLKLYEGEQHGFRQAKNIEDALDSELAFYGKIYGIPVPNAIEIKIDNLP